MTEEIRRLEDRIPELNKAVCDGETSRDDPCDDLCGGAGCGKCGDVSCGEGALTKSQDALKDAKDAEQLLKKKDLEAEASQSIKYIHPIYHSLIRKLSTRSTLSTAVFRRQMILLNKPMMLPMMPR